MSAHSLCVDCWTQINFMTGPLCQSCGTKLPDLTPAGTACGACQAQAPTYTQARAVAVYDEGISPLILALKHGDRLDLVPLLSQMIVRVVQENAWPVECVVPVPLHRRRLWSRRFNQCAELARTTARSLETSYTPQALMRIKSTRSQGGLSRSQRYRNVRGVFDVPPVYQGTVEGRNILLVDDVFTTGATVMSAASALRKAGAAHVYVITLARVEAEQTSKDLSLPVR